MKIIKFNIKNTLKSMFRENNQIEPIYLEIAELTLSMLYQFNPFHSLFEGYKWENKADECFKNTLTIWADAFMSWNMNDKIKIEQALLRCRNKNIIPSLGLFKAYYENNIEIIEADNMDSYISYLYKNSTWINGRQVLNGGLLVYSEWMYEEKRRK